LTTPPRRFAAAKSRSLSGDGVRQLLASYRGGAADDAAVVPGFKIEPGMIYTQVRAISARINQNYDAWPSEELKKSYKTFLGKPVFVNHANFDPEKARGRVVASRYVESGADKYVEVIQEIDAQRFPKLAKEIHEGGLDSVSMGVEAGFTKCSVCDNRATDMTDMCDHVKFHKGEFMRHAKTGEDTMVYENCYKLGFFELSYVFDPADETAVVSRVVVANTRTAAPKDPRAIHYDRGYKRSWHPKRKYLDEEEMAYGSRHGNGASDAFSEGWTDAASDYPHRYKEPEAWAERIKGDDESQQKQSSRRHGEAGDNDPDPVDPMKGDGFSAGYGDQPEPIQGPIVGGGATTPAKTFDRATEPITGDGYYELMNSPRGETGSSDPQAFKSLASRHAWQAWNHIPPEKKEKKPGKLRLLLKDLADPNAALDSLERHRKIREYRDFIKQHPGSLKAARLIVATEIARTDWSDLGRRAYGEGAPAKAASHPEVAAALQHLDPRSETARWIRSEYQQGYDTARKTSRRRQAAGEDELNRGMISPATSPAPPPAMKPDENTSTMSELANTPLGDLPYRPTSFPTAIPGAPSGGSSSGGGGVSGAGYVSPGGGTPDATGLLDNNRGLHDLIKQQFPDLTIGGYRPGGDGYDEHNKGALDIMTMDNDIAAQIRQIGFDNGVPYALWQQQQFNAPWYNGGGVSAMETRAGGDPTQNHMDHVHLAPPDMSLMPRSASRRHAWGETEAPEDIDTLRDQSEDDGQDEFHHYVDSPEELQTPDFDQTKRLDRAQEQQGLDADRRVEDIEEVGTSGQQGRGKAVAGRRRYAEDMMPPEGAMPPEESMAPEGMPPAGGEAPGAMGSLSPADELALLNQAEQDLEYAESELVEDYIGVPSAGPQMPPQEEGGQMPPQLASRRPVRSTASRRNVRETQKGRPMGINLSERGRVASRGRRLHADESGLTDGGPYGRNDLGESEEVHISHQFGGDGVPSAEAVANPTAGESISNTENTLVARVQHGTAQLRRDAAALAHLRQQKSAAAAVDSEAIGRRYVALCREANIRPTQQGFRRFYAECCDDNIIEPTTVNPELSGTDDQTIKGDDFDNVALDNVATQPKDASIHAFAAFDDWLARSTGRTARQHGNANFIRRQAARYIRATGLPLNNLFPTLEKVLVEARRAEDITNRKAAMRRVADMKLEVAAPGDRIDVERPVKNVTDAEAQASQYNLSDYGSNASDNLADPDLSTDSQIWAPGEGSKTSNRMADAVAAVRCAEAYIRAGMADADDKWKLIARFQTMRHATVVDRTRLLEAKNELDSQRTSRRSAGVSRGATSRSIPPGLGSGQRTAQTQRVADNDPRNDSLLFFK
jgi:hypothetical protein